MKGIDQNPSAATTGTTVRTVPKGGYVGAPASTFHAGYKRKGEQATITWNTTTVTLTDATGATDDKPAQPRSWHGPTRPPSTKP